VYYNVDNRFTPTNGQTNMQVRVTGSLWGGVSATVAFSIDLTKNCEYA